MEVIFRTNVDCCKHFMFGLSYEGDIGPNIGDDVVVYREESPRLKEVIMGVVGRTFKKSQKSYRMGIEVELNLDSYWREGGYTAFEKWVKS